MAQGWTRADPVVTISNGGLRAVLTGTGETLDYAGFAGRARPGLKIFWKVFATNTGPDFGVGIGTTSTSIAGGDFLGVGADSLCWFVNGDVYQNAGPIATLPAYVDGDSLEIALDQVNNKIWLRITNDNWNNDILANQNPATNTGGIPLGATLAAGPIVPAFNLFALTAQIDALFAPSSWLATPPVGFVDWDWEPWGVEPEPIIGSRYRRQALLRPSPSRRRRVRAADDVLPPAVSLAISLGGAGAAALAGTITRVVGFSGASITSSAGNIALTAAPTIASAAVTSAAGTLAERITPPTLSGVAGTAAAGSLARTITPPAIGTAGASASAGSFAEAVEPAILSGASVGLTAGNISAAPPLVMPGAAMTTTAGDLAKSLPGKIGGIGATSTAGSFLLAVPLGLAGVGTATAAGDLAKTVARILSGISAIAVAGAMDVSTAAAVSFQLVGGQVTSAAGTLARAIATQALPGALVIANPGDIGGRPTPGLTGVSATSGASALFPFVGGNFVGASANGGAGLIAGTGAATFALSGAGALVLAGNFVPELVRGLSGASVAVAAGNLAIAFGALALPGANTVASAGAFVESIAVALPGARVVTGAGAPIINALFLPGAAAAGAAGILAVTQIARVVGGASMLSIAGDIEVVVQSIVLHPPSQRARGFGGQLARVRMLGSHIRRPSPRTPPSRR